MARQRFVTPELWGEVNEDNKELMHDFLQEMKQQRRSPKTIHQYECDLKMIFVYVLLHKRNKSVLELRRKDFRDLSLWLTEERKVSAARVSRMLSVVRSMLTFCEIDDEIDYENNLCRHVKGLRREAVRGVDDDTYFFIPFETIQNIRQVLINNGEWAIATMIMVAYDSGCRRGEVVQVLKNGIEGNKTNTVIGKGNKRFRLYFTGETEELIHTYLDIRGEDEYEELLVRKEKLITYDLAYYYWKQALKMYNKRYKDNLECPFHALRHSRIDHLLNGEDPRLKDADGNNLKLDLRQVQGLVNHNDLSTTASYAKDRTEEQITEIFTIREEVTLYAA